MEPELDARKQRILEVIVQDYVATAEPVGSHVLVQRYSLGVKSATIRNEMAEMSERGYLRQPHTSSGRIPSDQGYRFYVDRLMHLPVIPEEQSATIQSAVESASTELDLLLRKTCSLLAAMTHLPAVATSPDADDTELRQTFLSPAGADKALLVLLFSSGRAENRLVNLRLSASDSLVLANALNERFGGRTLSSLRLIAENEEAPGELRHLRKPWSRLAREIREAVRVVAEETPMYIEGAHAALEHPEFRDVERLGQLLSTLQERAALLEMMENALETRPVARASDLHMVIGAEHLRPSLHGFSIVTSTYYVGERERGAIGVLGPTRMDYGRTAAAVRLMAQTIGDLLTQLSVSR